ncbi:MAG: DUF2911 domain-containing protein [Chitinophagaceae bacterium]|nr:DUF2911 domain-containing protein [Chitinophagaceae bacterium]
MKRLYFFCTLAIVTINLSAQMDIPPVGGNPRAMIAEEVGITSITIHYGRPDVNKREGKIFGDGNLVPYGFSTTNFLTSKNPSPGGPVPMRIRPLLLSMM